MIMVYLETLLTVEVCRMSRYAIGTNQPNSRLWECFHDSTTDFIQIFTHFPQAACLYSDFEKSYDANPVLAVLQKSMYTAPLVVVLIYATGCVLGQMWMKNRTSPDVSVALSVWNAILAGFSIYGAIRTVPHLLYRIGTVSFEETICEDPCTAFGSGAAGLATQLFVLSKVPELFDTAFLILKKKPVTFLHWYHHITVLLYCWNSYVTESSTGLYFVAMNYTVHSVMYTYYCPDGFPRSRSPCCRSRRCWLARWWCCARRTSTCSGERLTLRVRAMTTPPTLCPAG